MDVESAAVAAGQLLPDLIKALMSGTDPEDVRRELRRNRAEMDAAFDVAEARIKAGK